MSKFIIECANEQTGEFNADNLTKAKSKAKSFFKLDKHHYDIKVWKKINGDYQVVAKHSYQLQRWERIDS